MLKRRSARKHHTHTHTMEVSRQLHCYSAVWECPKGSGAEVLQPKQSVKRLQLSGLKLNSSPRPVYSSLIPGVPNPGVSLECQTLECPWSPTPVAGAFFLFNEDQGGDVRSKILFRKTCQLFDETAPQQLSGAAVQLPGCVPIHCSRSG